MRWTSSSPQMLVVPVELQATDGSWRTLSMLVDTGASVSALTPSGLSALGLSAPKAGAYQVRMPTASGEVWAPVMWMPPLRVGGRVLTDVTAVRCARCPAGMDGLLGLNVLARYTLTVDAAAGRVTLAPRTEGAEPGRDLWPWLERRVRRQAVEDAPGVRVAVTNHSDRVMARVRLTVGCVPEAPLVFQALLPRERQVQVMPTPDGQPCRDRRLTLEEGQW